MNLEYLTRMVRDEINKGTSVSDQQIKDKIRQALQLIEMEHDWEYLDRFVTFTLNPQSQSPRTLTMPVGMKSIEFFRWELPSGEMKYIYEVSPRDIKQVGVGMPTAYFKDGMEYIWLNKIPDEPYVGGMSYRQFTTWVDDPNFEPWILKVAHPYVFYRTCVLLAPFLREPTLLQLWAPLYKEAKETALMMNEELRYSNTDNKMHYE